MLLGLLCLLTVSQADYARETEAELVAALDQIIARKNVVFDEYLNLNNRLAQAARNHVPGGDTPLICFRRLQMLSRAAGSLNGDTGDLPPLKLAWLESNFEYDEPGATWYIPADRYWQLFDANRTAAWTEEVAWAAFQALVPRDECMSDCILGLILQQPAQYWKRLPTGLHIHEVVSRGVELAESAASDACYDLKQGEPLAKSVSPVSAGLVAQVRSSLVGVDLSEKREIVRYLDEAERKCSR
jgi:hypothetical protein